MNFKKYKRAYYDIPKFNRTWPDKVINSAPAWCSVDLRDGNQALVAPMSLEEKLGFFDLLVGLGIKEIEVAFPAASSTEFDFVRKLIDEGRIPDNVSIQVLTQTRPHIIEKTVEAVRGNKNAIIHFYNSTSSLQRRVVFKMDKSAIVDLAVSGAQMVKDLAPQCRYEYSPESFTGTEPEFALEICNAVIETIQPTPEKKLIINLPSTIELSSPNVYADQIEYMVSNLSRRDSIIVSLHPHNDRGCAIAASELGLLAGADRLEGTIFGNGERTGNADLIVVALNMFSQGIDPGLEIENISELVSAYEKYNRIPVGIRHPYAGELVYTAFSGSHQDAIKKGMDEFHSTNPDIWENPYLPINPEDLGREYEPIRINSQSGKGGVRFVLENKFGLVLPAPMLIEFSRCVTEKSDKTHSELSADAIYDLFHSEYVDIGVPFRLMNYEIAVSGDNSALTCELLVNGESKKYSGTGNGPLDAFCKILSSLSIDVEVVEYSEHALSQSTKSSAATYIGITDGNKKTFWGCGISTNINTASIRALISAVNRAVGSGLPFTDK